MTFFAESPCPKMVFPVKSVSLIAQSCQQGYTAAMVVDESRILQVCIFSTLHRNERRVKFSKLLPDVVTIADEVDAQLKQQILCFLPVEATEKKH